MTPSSHPDSEHDGNVVVVVHITHYEVERQPRLFSARAASTALGFHQPLIVFGGLLCWPQSAVCRGSRTWI